MYQPAFQLQTPPATVPNNMRPVRRRLLFDDDHAAEAYEHNIVLLTNITPSAAPVSVYTAQNEDSLQVLMSTLEASNMNRLHLQGMQHSAMYMEMQAQQLRARLQDKITTADAIINTLEELIRERVQLQNTIADMERDAPPNTPQSVYETTMTE